MRQTIWLNRLLDVAREMYYLQVRTLRLVSSKINNVICYYCIQLVGPRGSGRSSIARHLCSQLENGPYYVHTVFVDCSSLKGLSLNSTQPKYKSYKI